MRKYRPKTLIPAFIIVAITLCCLPSVGETRVGQKVNFKLHQLAQRSFSEISTNISRRDYPKAIEGLKELLAHYPDYDFPLGPLDKLLPRGENSSYLRMVDDHPYDIQGIVAMNKVVQNLREERKDDLAEFTYLLIALKCARTKVGLYAKGKVIEREKESLLECLEEKDKRQLDLLGNTEIGVKALSNLAKTLPQDSQHTIALYLYTMSAYPDTKASQQAALNLADMVYQGKDYQKAIYEYQWFLYRYPAHPESGRLWNRLGFALQQAGKVKESLAAYEEAIRFNPKTEFALHALEEKAKICYQEKNYDKTFLTCQQIADDFPGHKFNNPAIEKLFSEKRARQLQKLRDFQDKILFIYYPYSGRIPPLSQVFTEASVIPYARIIEEKSDDMGSIVALNRMIEAYAKEYLTQDLTNLIYLLVSLKYPIQEVGCYARGKFIEGFEKVLKKLECLEEKDRRQLDFLGNTEIGVKALSNLAKTLPQDSQHTIALYLYTMSAYPDTKASQQAALNLADMIYQGKDYQKAVYGYQWFLCRYPAHPESGRLWNRLGFALRQVGKVKESLAAYEEAIRFNPKTEFALHALEEKAKIYYQEKNYDKTFLACQQIVDDFPGRKFNNPAIEKLFSEKRARQLQKLRDFQDKILFIYYPYSGRILPLSQVFTEASVIPYAQIIEEKSDSMGSIVALNRMIEAYAKEYLTQDLTNLIYLLVSLKYPIQEVGCYARGKFIEGFEKVLKENEEHYIKIVEHPNDRIGLEALDKLVNKLGQGNPETALLCFYVRMRWHEKAVALKAEVKLGDFYYQCKGYQKAIAQYQLVLRQSPDGHDISLILSKIASSWFQLEEPNKAIETYGEIADRYPEDRLTPVSLEDAAEIHYHLEHYEEAFKICKRIKSDYPGYKIADSALTELVEKREVEAAVKVKSLKEEVAKYPSPFLSTGEDRGTKAMDELASILDMEKSEDVFSAYEDIVAKFPDAKVGILSRVKLGDVLRRQGKLEEAISRYQQVAQEYPGTPYALLAEEGMGDCYYKRKQYFNAIKRYKAVALVYLENDKMRREDIMELRVHKDYEQCPAEELIAEALYLKGYLLLTRGKLWESIPKMKRSLSLYEKLVGDYPIGERVADNCFNLMIAYSQLEDYQEAVNHGLAIFKRLSRKYRGKVRLQDCSEKLAATYQTGRLVRSFFQQCEEAVNNKSEEVRNPQQIVAQMRVPLEVMKRPRFAEKSNLTVKEEALVELLPTIVLYAQDQILVNCYKRLLAKYSNHDPTVGAMQCLTLYFFLTRERKEAEDRYSDVIRECEKILPGFSKGQILFSSLETLADVYRRLGKRDEAIETYRAVAARYPEEEGAKAQSQIIDIYGTGMQMYSEAIEECRKLIKKFPDTKEAIHSQFLIGQFYYLQGNYGLALKELEKYLRDYPESEWVVGTRWYTALCHIRRRDHEKAIRTLQEFIGDYPRNDLAARAQFLIGWSYLSQMQYEQAKRELQKVLDRYPTNTALVQRARDFIQRAEKAEEQRRQKAGR